jgi:hypothetical protein
MRFAENPKKIENIVMPNMKQFQELYHPLLLKLFPAMDLAASTLMQDLGESATKPLLDQLPSTLKNEITSFASADNSRQ